MDSLKADEKARLRRESLARRDALAPDERARLSAQVALRVAGVIADLEAKSVAAYVPLRSEVDVMPLLDLVIERKAITCLPAIVGDDLVFRSWVPGSELVPGPFNSREPPANAAEIVPDVVVVPLAAFDRRGNRLGYGRGFFDRAIAGLRQRGLDPWLVGAAFAVQEVEAIPVEPHDVPLNAIVTEAESVIPAGG